MAIFRREPPNGGVECRCVDQYIASSRVVSAATVICYQHGATDLGKLMTVIAGSSKCRSLLMAGDG